MPGIVQLVVKRNSGGFLKALNLDYLGAELSLYNKLFDEENCKIAVNMYESKGLVADKEAETHLKTHIKYLYDNRDRFFGNARSIRKIVEKSS